MKLDWAEEHTQDWVVRDALMATFADTRDYHISGQVVVDNYYYICVMLRRWAADNPDAVPEWRSLPTWRRIIRWQRRSTDPAPSARLDVALRDFLTAGSNRIGSDNPWSITTRPGGMKRSNGLAEYAIGRIRQVTWQKWINLSPPPRPPRIFTQEEWEREWIPSFATPD
jgi:hypothetical protein